MNNKQVVHVNVRSIKIKKYVIPIVLFILFVISIMSVILFSQERVDSYALIIILTLLFIFIFFCIKTFYAKLTRCFCTTPQNTLSQLSIVDSKANAKEVEELENPIVSIPVPSKNQVEKLSPVAEANTLNSDEENKSVSTSSAYSKRVAFQRIVNESTMERKYITAQNISKYNSRTTKSEDTYAVEALPIEGDEEVDLHGDDFFVVHSLRFPESNHSEVSAYEVLSTDDLPNAEQKTEEDLSIASTDRLLDHFSDKRLSNEYEEGN